MHFFDSHTHLNHNDLFPNRKNHIQNFIDNGGIGLINIGVDHTYNTRSLEIAQQSASLFPQTIVKSTIGLHPYEIAIGNITSENYEAKREEMKSLYNTTTKDYIVAIGEIGIDTYRPNTENTLTLQKTLFRQQCEFARSLHLPIVIHTRANRDATHEVLQDFTDLTIYFHCRPYGPEQIKIIKETYDDFYIWFCWNISYPKAEIIRKSLRYLVYNNHNYPESIISWKLINSHPEELPFKKDIYLKNILIETDAPYLAPQSHRGKQNTPLLVKENYIYISALIGRDISLEVIENTKRCYHLTS